MPLKKSEISKALREGKRVLSREIVSEEVWLESIFEGYWSYLIRSKQVPKSRGILHEHVSSQFREKVSANELTGSNMKKWLMSLLTVEIDR